MTAISGHDPLDPDIDAAVRAALEVLADLTRSVTDIALPGVDSYTALSAETFQYHAMLLADPDAKPALAAMICAGAPDQP